MSGSRSDADFDAFEQARRQDAAGFFSEEFWVARAPGRLDVMGGIADYSGSLVAEMPIAPAAVAGVQVGGDDDGSVVVRSLNAAAEGLETEVALPAALFVNPVSLLRWTLDAPRERRWAAYAAGCVAILRAEGLFPRKTGARILLRSEVPLGAGVSSSAAVEVATMRALLAALGQELDGLTLARWCQRVENEVVDAPCGIMDQVTCALGESGELLLLLCQPHTLQGTVKLPDGWRVFGIDSGVKHSVAGHGYTETRVAAFMGAKILADRAGEGFGGYLCNITPERYAQLAPPSDPLPETLGGAAFLAAHGGILDTVTRVVPETTYRVRAATEHPIGERRRVETFVACLSDGSEEALAEAGRQMVAAHESYSRCGLGTTETDALVALALGQPGVVGAKITGGGSGGTVCVLCRTEHEAAAIAAVRDGYRARTGIDARLIRGTSPGALATPPRRHAP